MRAKDKGRVKDNVRQDKLDRIFLAEKLLYKLVYEFYKDPMRTPIWISE